MAVLRIQLLLFYQCEWLLLVLVVFQGAVDSNADHADHAG